ncbi:MAG: histidine kinase [Coriobacteriia bacterium]|nr:histidine kinase [Coriobacteriia bacterium]
MHMFSVQELNIAIELWGAAFCLIGIACTLLFARVDGRYRNHMIAAFTFGFIWASGDALAGLYRGEPGNAAWIATHVGNAATYMSGYMLIVAIVVYLCDRIEEAGGNPHRWWRVGIAVGAAIMCLLTLFGVFYHIDDSNVYHRTDLYWVALAFVVVASLGIGIIATRERERLGTMAHAIMFFFAITPIITSVIQMSVYGINLVMAVSILGLILLFFEMQRHSSNMLVQRTEELARAQTEAAESRIAVMVSQIQPHFLFNTLDTIYGLCDEDPQLAKQAIASFSRYLRANLNSLKRTTPVPISVEMEHVRTFLELERTSDENRLEYEIDMQDADFSVPALAIETLVENAVKHGIGGKVEGGTVVVRTRELPDEHTVTIIDNGIGFDPDAIIDGEAHVGLANTRSRLAAMCNGTMDVQSELGVGTTVVVHIPKKEGER